MKGRSLKWLRYLHLLSVSIWFGTTAGIGALAFIGFSNQSETYFMSIAPLIPLFYKKIILPIAIFTILQGFIYGLCTKWRFFKHRWVLLKWFFTLLLIPCIGAGTIGQIFSIMDTIDRSGFQGGLSDGGTVLLSISLQILIMMIMIGISVFKKPQK